MQRSMASGFWYRIAFREAAGPSAFGVCAIAAARCGFRAATWKM